MPGSSASSAPTAPGIPGAAPVVAEANNGGLQGPNSGNVGSAANPGGNQAVLVSSAPARAATAANVTALQTATTPNANANTTSTPAPTPSVVPQSSGTPSPSTFTPPKGATQSTLSNGTTAYYTPASADGSTPESMTDANGNALTYSQAAGGWIDPTTGAAPVSPGATGSTSSSPYDAAVASIADPGIRAAYSATLASQDNEAQTLQQTITALQSPTNTAANDPTTIAAVAAINAKFAILIQQMQAKNAQVIGSASSQAAAFGGLGVQGNAMDGTFMSNETSDAAQRITVLQDQQASLIAQANAAFSSNNAKALNDAMTQLSDVTSKQQTALAALNTAMGKQVTENQAQQKIDLTSTKDAVSNDIAQSTKIAAGIAANISASGLTDPTQIQAYIAGIAAQYGISNPDILYSQVVTAGQTTAKNNASIANTTDEIANRDTNTGLKASVDQQNNSDNAQKAMIAYKTYQAKVAAGTLGGKATAAPAYKFSSTATASLYAAGETDASIKQLSQDIAQYGPQYVLTNGQGLTPDTTAVIKTEFGL